MNIVWFDGKSISNHTYHKARKVHCTYTVHHVTTTFLKTWKIVFLIKYIWASVGPNLNNKKFPTTIICPLIKSAVYYLENSFEPAGFIRENLGKSLS